MEMIRLEPNNWGTYHVPASAKMNNNRLNVMVFCSYSYGYMALKQLIALSGLGRINIAGVVTDDITSDKAQINKHNRFWKNFNQIRQQALYKDILNLSLKNGIPVYTGRIKHEYFYDLVQKSKPDLFIIAGLGQILNQFLFTYPSLGAFNFHPGTSLDKNEYRGVDPFNEMMDKNEQFSHMNVHAVTEIIDGGDVVGRSIPINISFEHEINNFIEKKIMLYDKITLATPYLVRNLIDTAIESSLNGYYKITQVPNDVSPTIQAILEQPIGQKKYTFKPPSENKLIAQVITLGE